MFALQEGTYIAGKSEQCASEWEFRLTSELTVSPGHKHLFPRDPFSKSFPGDPALVLMHMTSLPGGTVPILSDSCVSMQADSPSLSVSSFSCAVYICTEDWSRDKSA